MTDVRSFLGFINQYRKCIPKYAHVAGPLNELISGVDSKKKKKEVQWTPECLEASKALKEHCCTTPVLAYADYKKPFRLHTDASDLGLGAVLYQQDENGKNRVIAYASKTLSQAEKNYPTHKLDFLALKWAVTSRFHEYLYGGEFAVYTDNNPLLMYSQQLTWMPQVKDGLQHWPTTTLVCTISWVRQIKRQMLCRGFLIEKRNYTLVKMQSEL